MERYLIINADDFGMCRAANLAVFDLFKLGGITSATIMAPCAWAPEAAKFAKENPEFAIGVHLTTTSEWSKYRWAPITGGESLRDEDGYMWHKSGDFEKNADISEAEDEIRAQITRLNKLGLTNPSHLDNHMGSLYGLEEGRFEMLSLVIETAGEYGLPFRFPSKFTDEQFEREMKGINIPKEMIEKMFGKFTEYGREQGVAMIDYLIPGDWDGPQSDSFEAYREYIYELYRGFPEGITETYIHPSLECDELKGTSSSWEHRVWEHRLFADPMTMRHIESLGIKLINYRDLAEIRGIGK